MRQVEKPNLAILTADDIVLKRKMLRRKLYEQEDLKSIRIAVLGGSTTNEVVDLLELWLLDAGFKPIFYHSEFGRFYVDAVHDTDSLVAFQPDLVYLHVSVINIQQFTPLQASESEFGDSVHAEFSRYEEIWNSLEEKIGCTVIQNNFELPLVAVLGNLDAALGGGHTRFVNELNRMFFGAATTRKKLLIQDACSISARVGLKQWFDADRWFGYKIYTTPEGSYALAVSLASLVRALYGRTRKVLVLDLDNTVWGGVIGDDGIDAIQLGRETPVAEAYTAFQEYCLALRNRGILLAVCSKNDEVTAKQGFEHPDSVLKLEHISCFKANWNPKPENIALIAMELNLGVDSFVFVDDNPAERAIVESVLPDVAVPDVGSDVTQYAAIIEAGRYFEQASFSQEDLARAALYQENSRRAATESKFADYGAYLDSLEMTAEIGRFNSLYLDRIAQLTNKTNQFNLTTRRYSVAEMEAVLHDADSIGLYGKLSDRFGDNGLITIVLGRRAGEVLELDLWLMSCRVLKRDMEFAMLDALVEHARELGVSTLRGTYLPTRKNAMVADHYIKLGFAPEIAQADGSATFVLGIENYTRLNTHIRVAGYREPIR